VVTPVSGALFARVPQSQIFYSSPPANGVQICEGPQISKRTGIGWRCSHTLLGILPNFLPLHMDEVVRFIPKSDLERARLIREARAIYESIFPSADLASEQWGLKE
jgi:hypothetical protein